MVKSGMLDGWPRHWACCAKTGSVSNRYCEPHEDALFVEPKTTVRDFVRGLRKHITR